MHVDDFLAGEELEHAIACDDEEEVGWGDLHGVHLRVDPDALGGEVAENVREGRARVEPIAGRAQTRGGVPLVGELALGRGRGRPPPARRT